MLYYYLWRRNREGKSCPGVNLPHTVVYKAGFPGHWYFSSATEGRILRKNKQSVVNKAIADTFSRRNQSKRSEICAYHVYIVGPRLKLQQRH